MKPDLSILVVGYNCPEEIDTCYASLVAEGITSLRWEFLVCENGTARHCEMLALAKNKGFKLIEAETNIGFGQANNLLALQATSDILLCLNPDTMMKPGVLAQLVNHLKTHPQCGTCGPLLENPDGSLQDGWGEPTNLWWDFCESHYLQGWYRKRAWKRKWGSPTQPWSVGHISGACLCLRTSLWNELGGFDPDFFLNHEDIELCDRIRKRSLRVEVLPAARVIHAEGTTQRTNWHRYTFHRLQGKWIYISKRYHSWQLLLAKALWWESTAIKMSVGWLILRGQGRSRLGGFWQAMQWVLKGT